MLQNVVAVFVCFRRWRNHVVVVRGQQANTLLVYYCFCLIPVCIFCGSRVTEIILVRIDHWSVGGLPGGGSLQFAAVQHFMEFVVFTRCQHHSQRRFLLSLPQDISSAFRRYIRPTTVISYCIKLTSQLDAACAKKTLPPMSCPVLSRPLDAGVP